MIRLGPLGWSGIISPRQRRQTPFLPCKVTQTPGLRVWTSLGAVIPPTTHGSARTPSGPWLANRVGEEGERNYSCRCDFCHIRASGKSKSCLIKGCGTMNPIRNMFPRTWWVVLWESDSPQTRPVGPQQDGPDSARCLFPSKRYPLISFIEAFLTKGL